MHIRLLQAAMLAAALALAGGPGHASAVLPAPTTSTAPAAIRCEPAKPPSPPRPPRPPKPADPPAAVSNVCTPTVNVHLQTGLQPGTGEAAKPAGAASAASAPLPPLQPADPPDVFRFKVKDLIEADISSRSRLLVWALVAVFVGFGVVVVVGLRSVAASGAARKGTPWLVLGAAVVVAGVLAYLAIRMLVPTGVAPQTIDRMYALTTGQGARLDDALANWQQLANQMRAQLAESRQELAATQRLVVAQMQQPGPAMALPGGGLWLWSALVLVLVLALGAAAGGTAAAAWRRRPPVVVNVAPGAAARSSTDEAMPGEPPPSPVPVHDTVPPPLPLAELYAVEDQLAHLVAQVRSDPSAAHPSAELDLGGFIQSLDALRQRLEGAPPGSGSAGPRLLPRLNATLQAHEAVHAELRALETLLAERHAEPPITWRSKALPALDRARRAIVAQCTTRLAGPAKGFQL